jgi:hypothetical protein
MLINLINNLWKYATLCVVVIIFLNPEMIELALFIDAIGLEMFIMLLEIQVLIMLCEILNRKIRPMFEFIELYCSRNFSMITWGSIKENPEGLTYSEQGSATLTYALCFSAFFGVVHNV